MGPNLRKSEDDGCCCGCAEKKKDDADKHESYSNISTAMLTVSTFASGITFNIILKPSGNPPAQALLYLSYANSLFCGAIMGCVLIKVSVELCKSSVDYVTKWKEKVKKVKSGDSKWKEGVDSRIEERDRWRASNGRGGPSARRTMKTWKKIDNEEWRRIVVKEFRMTYEGDPREMLLQWLYTEEYAPRMMKEIGHWILSIETAIVAAILFVALYFLLLACKYFLQIEGPFLAGTIIYWFFCGTTISMAYLLSLFGNWMRWKENTMLEEDTLELESFWILRHVLGCLSILKAVYFADPPNTTPDTPIDTSPNQEEQPKKEVV